MNLIKSILKEILFALGIVKRGKNYITNKKKYLRGYSIGDYTYGTPTVLMPCNGAVLKIGKFCSIARDVVIFLGGNHRVDWVSTYPFGSFTKQFPNAMGIKGHPTTNGNVTIGNDVWIGSNVTILSGISIADGAVLASGAVITKDIGPYEIWGGNPAKLIKKRFDDDLIKKLLIIKWWDWPVDKINQNVTDLSQGDISLFVSRNLK